MKILSIDTTVVAGSIALSNGTMLVAQEQQGVAGTHSERLIPSIDHLLRLACWRKEDVEALAVAIGPGSFTGLRIGLAAAKGIALARNLPIAGVSSLRSLALNGAGFPGTVVPLIDARRGELFAWAARVTADGSVEGLTDEFVAPPEVVIRRLQGTPGDLLLVGDGAIAYGDVLTGAIGGRARLAVGTALRPQAINLAILAMERLEGGRGDDVVTVAPNYIRRSDAEIGFMGRPRR